MLGTRAPLEEMYRLHPPRISSADDVGGAGNEQSNNEEDMCCRTSVLLRSNDGPCAQDPANTIPDKWIAGSGATYRMTRSPDKMCNIRPTNDKVSVDDSHMVDIVGHRRLTVVFPGNPTAKLDVVFVPDLSCNLFLLMAAHRCVV